MLCAARVGVQSVKNNQKNSQFWLFFNIFFAFYIKYHVWVKTLEVFSMSFYTGIRTENMPGPITCNPLKGLCDKVCLQVKKVFDACIMERHIEDETLTLTNFMPENPTAPLTFVSGQSSSSMLPTLSDVVVTRFDDRPNFARVSGTATMPIEIAYIDANNVSGTAQTSITMNFDVVLFVPQPSIIPYKIEPVASVVVPKATFVDGSTITLDACVMLIIKVVAETEILVPSYGYCDIPPCQEFTQDVCAGFFELPLFPNAQPIIPNTNNTQNNGF